MARSRVAQVCASERVWTRRENLDRRTSSSTRCHLQTTMAKRSASPARTNGHSNGHPNGHNGKLNGKNGHASTPTTPLEHAARASSLLLTGFTVALVLLASLALAPMAPQSPLKLKLGTHAFVELDAAPFALLNDSAAVMSTLRSAADAGGLTVVSEQLHEFPVMGVSAVLLVSESHLSIHTWPGTAPPPSTSSRAARRCCPASPAPPPSTTLSAGGHASARCRCWAGSACAARRRCATRPPASARRHGAGARPRRAPRARVHWMERGLADRGPGAIPPASAHK